MTGKLTPADVESAIRQNPGIKEVGLKNLLNVSRSAIRFSLVLLQKNVYLYEDDDGGLFIDKP